MSDTFRQSIEKAIEPITAVIETIKGGKSPVQDLPTEAPTANLPATVPAVERYFHNAFDRFFAIFVCSGNLYDVISAFGMIIERLGRAKFVLAALIYVIKRDNLFKRWGYDSVEEFVGALPARFRFSRQTFYNLLWAGQVLVEHFGFLEYGLKPKAQIDLSFLYRNFAKLPILWKAIYRRKMPLSSELYGHFLNDSKAAFEKYVRGEVKPRSTGKQRAATKYEKPSLDPAKQRICETIARGYRVGFIVDQPDRVAIDIAIQFKVRRAANAAYVRATSNDLSTVTGHDLSEMVPGHLKESISGLEQAIATLDLEAIHSILAEQFRTLTDLRLAQAYLVHRLKIDERLMRQFADFDITCASDFAARYLDIDAAMFKWLSRLGRNLVFYAPVFGENLDLDFDGSLDKLSILHIAMETHVGQAPLVIEMLKTLSVAKFRRFARDRDYHPEREPEPVSRRTIALSKDELLHYDALVAAGHKVEIIELRNPKEAETFERWVKRFELLPDAVIDEPLMLPASKTPILLPAHPELALPAPQSTSIAA